jgi:ABC-2 type transport system ATP-binding protein
VHVDPDILLVDEVLAVGDEPFQRKCMDRIRGFQHEGRTIVLVTHSLETVADLCDRAIVLESGRVIADGAPLESLRTLRSEFEHTRREELERQQEHVEVTGGDAPPRARVDKVEVLTPSGASLENVRPGEELAVRLTITAGQPIDMPTIGIGVETALGVSVYGTSTKLLGRGIERLEGTQQFTFRLRDLYLGEGTYTVHGAVAAPSGEELHRLLEGATLTVTGDGRGVGFVTADAELVV